MFTILLTIGLSIGIPPAAEAVLGDRLFGLPTLRDGYGDPLPEGAIARLGSVRWRVNQNNQGILFSRDGRRCYTLGTTAQAFEYPSGSRIDLSNCSTNAFDGALSPDGRFLYLSSPGQVVTYRYDLFRGRLTPVVPVNARSAARMGNGGYVNFSRDGRHAIELAMFNNGPKPRFELRHLALGDTVEARRITVLDGAQIQIGVSSISDEGRYAAILEGGEPVAGTSSHPTIHLWDLKSARSARLTMPPETMLFKVKFAPRSDDLLVRCFDRFRLYSNPFREEGGKARLLTEKKLDGMDYSVSPQTGNLMCGEFVVEGNSLAYADNMGSIVLADFPTLKTVWKRKYANGSGYLSSLAFTPDGKKIAFATQAGRLIRFLDRADGRELTPPGHTETAQRVLFHPTRPLLITSSYSNNIRFWNWQAGPARDGGVPAGPAFHQSASHILEDQESTYGLRSSLLFVRDGNRLVVPAFGERAFEYDFDGRRRFRLRTLNPAVAANPAGPAGANSNPESMVFSPDGAKFIEYDPNSQSASLFNGTMPLVPPCPAPLIGHRRYGFSSDSAIAAFALTTEQVAYVDAKTGNPMPLSARPGERFVGGQRLLAAMDSSMFDTTFAVRLIDLRTGQPWCERYTSQACHAFTADGHYAATYDVGDRNRIVVREVASGETVAAFAGRSRTDELNVQDLEFSPDGRFLASALDDGTILLWNTDPATRRYQVRGPADAKGMAALLREPKARLAFAGIGYALAHPAEALAHFRAHYSSASKPEEKRAEELYRQLGEAKHSRRVDAHRQLALLAPLLWEWFDGLGRRSADADVSEWLRKIRRQPLFPRREPDVLFAVRMVECLERMGTPEAKAYLKELAGQGDWAALTARMSLERLGK